MMRDIGEFQGAVNRILELQQEDGAIPWVEAGVFDPWNHVECAMALTVAGEWSAARQAYRYLRNTQALNGSWAAEYGNAAPLDDEGMRLKPEHSVKVYDTNFTAYVAMGVWHFYQCTQDMGFLDAYWPMTRAAMSFVLAHQSPEGDIRWAAKSSATPDDDALLAGCSSIYKSLEAAILIAEERDGSAANWARARARLGGAIRSKPHRFDRTWPSKARFSMDWYYPILSGAVSGEAADRRLAEGWDRFVNNDFGCRCVDDQPWATVAETCELALALLKVGDRQRAEALFGVQLSRRDESGACWMGYQWEEQLFWPIERPSWSSAAMILAGDALYGWSRARQIFTAPTLLEPGAGEPATQSGEYARAI